MILMNDFRAEPAELREAMFDAVRQVIDSGSYILGKEVVAFENQWATACGVAYGIGVGNGMDAIEIALRTLGIGSGDEVITTSMTAFATTVAVIRAGATPVLADIDPDTALISIESAQRCVSPRTKAVVLVHLYGQVRGMEAWTAFCTERRIALIEDCAQAHLAVWHGKVAGSFGTVGAFSFYPTKNLGAAGDAGMLVTQAKLIAERASRLRNYGQSVRYQHPEFGMNSRLDEIQAAMLAQRLRWLPEFTDRRRQIGRAYREGIRNTQIQLLAAPEESSAHVYHLFVITCLKRDALLVHLQAQQIQSLIHYPVPIHRQEPCRNMARDPRGLGASELHGTTCLSLPCHPQMTDIDVDAVISAVNSFQ